VTFYPRVDAVGLYDQSHEKCIIILIFLLNFQAVSQKDAPLNNFFLFDGREGCGIVERLGY
jgi:hypothetical protein